MKERKKKRQWEGGRIRTVQVSVYQGSKTSWHQNTNHYNVQCTSFIPKKCHYFQLPPPPPSTLSQYPTLVPGKNYISVKICLYIYMCVCVCVCVYITLNHPPIAISTSHRCGIGDLSSFAAATATNDTPAGQGQSVGWTLETFPVTRLQARDVALYCWKSTPRSTQPGLFLWVASTCLSRHSEWLLCP